MVVTMVWMESWAVVIISLCVLIAIGVLLLCCICWDSRKRARHHFYILDENGLTKVGSTDLNITVTNEVENNQKARNMFRHLSSTDNFANTFTSKILSTAEAKKHHSERDLIQSMEITDTFDNAVLRLHEKDNNNLPLTTANGLDREEDCTSCISEDSKYTFYSTNHLARTVSVADTMRSASSQFDLNYVS